MVPLVIVDDQTGMCESLSILFRMEGFNTISTTDPKEALALISAGSPAVLLTDLRMQGFDGIELLRAVKSCSPRSEVILMTAYASIDSAVSAMKLGAFDYIVKPFKNEAILAKVRRAAEKAESSCKAGSIPQDCGSWDAADLIAESNAFREVIQLAQRLAPTDLTVLLSGETGTGKSLIARCIHRRSRRSKGPFVAVNCSALPESLMESELFGHERGAFTGAGGSHKGLFQAANGGTLFLDEVGLLPPDQQPKLLHVLEDRMIRPVGSSRSISVDVRVIAATNSPLDRLVAAGEFREDLFYRLNAASICIPPLRERTEDIPRLVARILKAWTGEGGKVVSISPEAINGLIGYDFPGNVRELENAVRFAAVICSGSVILPSDLPATILKVRIDPSATHAIAPYCSDVSLQLTSITRNTILNSLSRNQGNMAQSARELGISRTTLWRRLKEYKVNLPLPS